MKYMERSLILGVLLCSSACATDWPFYPMIHPDGSRTWRVEMPWSQLKYVPAKYRNSPHRDDWIAGSYITHNRFCDAWEITSKRETKKKLFLEGRCK